MGGGVVHWLLVLGRYLWASPASALGLLFVPMAWLSGGEARAVQGVLEIHGRAVAWVLAHCTLLRGGASALTLGHVVLGRNRHLLDFTRDHERVHVRQYERWGPLFLPAYGLASLVLWIRGRDPYRDNPFERQAYDRERR